MTTTMATAARLKKTIGINLSYLWSRWFMHIHIMCIAARRSSHCLYADRHVVQPQCTHSRCRPVDTPLTALFRLTISYCFNDNQLKIAFIAMFARHLSSVGFCLWFFFEAVGWNEGNERHQSPFNATPLIPQCSDGTRERERERRLKNRNKNSDKDRRQQSTKRRGKIRNARIETGLYICASQVLINRS